MQADLKEQYMRFYVEENPLAVIEWDKDFLIAKWNPSAEKLFGYTKDEMIGRHYDRIVPEFEKEKVDNTGKQLMNNSGGLRCTNYNLTKDGRLIYCEWFNTSLVDANDNVIGVLSLIYDVTEQKALGDELTKTKKHLEAIVESFPDIVAIIDRDKRISEIYPSFIREKNPEVYSMIGGNLLEHIKEVDFERYEELKSIFSNIDTNRSLNFTIRAKMPFGNLGERSFEAHIKAFNDEKYMVILRDITEKERLQILMDFQSAINKLSENNRKAMSTLFKSDSKGEL